MAMPFRRILVPHDGSEHATRALEIAARLAAQARGRLVVLRAVQPLLAFGDLGAEETTPWIPPEEVVASELRDLEGLVRRVLRARRGPPAECRVVVGDAYRSIMDAAREVDLIAMGTHGRTGLAHLVIGSVAEKVVRHAPVPVLTIPPDRPAGAPRGPRVAGWSAAVRRPPRRGAMLRASRGQS